MPKEINKDLASPSPENAENDLEIFANRRIAELTARVTNLKELWRAQSKESLPVGENFDKEISQIEQTLADFEVSVRDKLKADGEGFPEAQKKGAIEILTKESVKKIKSLESNMGLNAPKQADKKLDANTPETQSGASEFTFTDLKEYEQMAYSSVFEAIGSVKDKKIAKLLREKYDNFLATAKELVVDNKLGNEEKPKLVEEKFQEFLTEIGNIVDKEQVDPQESVEVTMQEAKPQSPKAVASLDESLPVDKDAVVSDKDNGEKASGDVENKKSEESIKEADKEALSEPEEAKENPETIRERLIAFVNEKIDSLTIEVDALYAELSSQADGEEKIVYLDNINNILEIKAEQIVEDDSMSFEQRQKEIEISFQEFKEKLKVIREGGEIGLPKPEEDKKIAKGKKFKKVIENIAKFGKGTKELAKTKEGRGFLVKTAYDTVSTVFGIKFATDLALVVVGKGDIYNYLKQKGEVRKEKSSIKESLAKGEKAKVKEIIEASKNISSEEKKVLLDRLESLDQEYATKGKELEEEKQDRVQETLNAYIQNKTKGAKIARDALNTAFMATGLGAFRGGAYLLGSMAERMQKASTKHDKERFVLEDEESEEAKTQEAKVNFILRDLVVSSTVETFRSLVGKGKTKESEHKAMDHVQALGNIARALGLGMTMVHAGSFSGSINEVLDNLQEKGIAGGAWSTAKDNFVENADKVLLGALPNEDNANPELVAESKGGLSTWEQIKNLYDNKPQEDDLLSDDGVKEVTIDMNGQDPKELNTMATHFEDTIDSSEVKGADSIWRSTHDIFETHAKELGYQGDPNDQEALFKWAESQTANAVNQLSQEQGGSLADLVHDGDKVSVEIVDGQPHLSFEASSGIETGHLADTNVEHLMDSHHFSDNIEHRLSIDTASGDQYLEIKSGEEVYKVYDWDRDGQPDLVFPDGHHQEMSSEELSKFFADKNIITKPEIDPAETDAESTELAKQATANKIDSFIGKREGVYSHDMFAVAKEKGQLDEIFRHILSGNDHKQAESFVADYFKDNSLSDNKRGIFSFELNRMIGTEFGKGYSGTIDDMLKSFDANVITNFNDLDKYFSQDSGHDWVAIKVGDQYALVYKDGGGIFGKAKFFIDTNGDGESYSLKLSAGAMKEVFEGKRPLGYEGKLPT